MERDLAGFPTLTAPEGMNIWDDNDPEMVAIRAAAERIVQNIVADDIQVCADGHAEQLGLAERIVQNIRRDSMEGIVKPFGWSLELLSTGGL